jgi:glycerol-3-phosphate acyltransferase PlsY
MSINQGILLLLFAYLIGSIPSSVWIGKYFYGKDVRQYGSGNAGATNTFRVIGKRAGWIVLFLDSLKGFIAVQLPFLVDFAANDPVLFENVRVLCGAAAVLGHVFPVFAGFRGGKGIATLMGIVVGIHHIAALCCLSLFLVILFSTRYVSLGSILASIFYACFVLWIDPASHDATIIFGIAIPLLVIFTHLPNIKRLLNGNENRVYLFDQDH